MLLLPLLKMLLKLFCRADARAVATSWLSSDPRGTQRLFVSGRTWTVLRISQSVSQLAISWKSVDYNFNKKAAATPAATPSAAASLMTMSSIGMRV